MYLEMGGGGWVGRKEGGVGELEKGKGRVCYLTIPGNGCKGLQEIRLKHSNSAILIKKLFILLTLLCIHSIRSCQTLRRKLIKTG